MSDLLPHLKEGTFFLAANCEQTSLPWQPIETAPKAGAKVLVANRHTKAVGFVWPSEALQPAADGSTLFEFWCEVIHPKETAKA